MNYRSAVEFYASTKSSDIFDNLGPSHAADVLENMFKYADNEIFIFSGYLDKEVADEPKLISEVTKYLKNNKKVNLFLEQFPEKEDQSNLYLKLYEASQNNNNVKIQQAPPEFIVDLKKIFSSGKALHFIVTDNNAFRVETHPIEFKAKCSFNFQEYSSILLTTFKKYL